jgi:putative flippase GtrA
MLKKLLINRSDHGLVQMFRYGLVVAIAAPIDLGGYIILKSQFHVYYVLAATISFTVSLIANYFLSIAWVWRTHSGRQRHIDAVIFGIIGFVGLGLTDLIVWVFTDFVGFNYVVSKLVAFCVVFFWSFGARHFLFEMHGGIYLISLGERLSSSLNNRK